MVSIALVTFALVNRTHILIDLFPLASELEVPLFLFFFVSLMIGIMIGSFIMMGRKWRADHALRQEKRKSKQLEEEVQILQSELQIQSNIAKLTHSN